MKHYQRIYEDLLRDKKIWHSSKIEAATGPIEEFTEQVRSFLAKTYQELFYIAMCFLWLEKQLLFNGKRRIRRFRSGHAFDTLYGLYMAHMVGRDQATLTRSRWFMVSAMVASEVCPEFFKHNPFEEPEYYQWPFEHAGIDFLTFVYQVDNRMELLEYADKMKMTFRDFKNWATNYVLCYNDEQGEEIYRIGLNQDRVQHIQRKGWDAAAAANSLQELIKHESEKTQTNCNDNQRG